MTVVVDVSASGDGDRGGWDVAVHLRSGVRRRRVVTTSEPGERRVPLPDPDERPPAGADASSWDRTHDAALALVRAAERKDPDQDLAALGRHLFDALLGHDIWRAIEDEAAGAVIAVGLRTAARDGDLDGLNWELLHDGTSHLALRRERPLALVRLVRGARAELRPVGGMPRLLFAVGSSLSDGSIRAGAELMGLLRGIELVDPDDPAAGSVHPRVATEVTLTSLGAACRSFRPDLLHLVGHGAWDDDAGHGVIELRDEQARGKAKRRSAAELLQVIGTPAAVLLSACATADARQGGASMAAELVEGGVPLVLAMAGDVRDAACRMFTRALIAAVNDGVPFLHAVAGGRQAAFLEGAAKADSIEWALPCVVAAAPFDPEWRFVTCSGHRVTKLVGKLGFADRPLFAGREEYLDHLDDLLRPGGLSQLVVLAPGPVALGGTRLLRELGAAALRRGDLPIMVGPARSSADAPATVPDLLRQLGEKIVETAQTAGIEPPPVGLRALANASFAAGSGGVDEHVAVATARADLFDLRDRLAAQDDPVVRRDGVPLLLFDDVHLYTDSLGWLLGTLRGNGFGASEPEVPVVLLGKPHESVGGQLAAYKGSSPTTWRQRTLPHITELTDDRDVLVFLTWFLHPDVRIEDGPDRVYVPCTTGDWWYGIMRALFQDRPFYDPVQLKTAGLNFAKSPLWSELDEQAILATYALVRR